MASDPVTLTKEDGSGKTNSNSYASVADGDAYHLGHLYSPAWDELDETKKAAALVMASRLIDAEYQFGGRKAMTGQAMQWPRLNCPEPDGATAVFKASDFYPAVQPNVQIEGAGAGQIRIITAVVVVPGNVVPKAVVEATCELARELAIVDRTASPPGEGVASTEESENETVTTGASNTNTGVSSNQTHVTGSASKLVYSKADTRPIIPRVVQALLAKYGSLFASKSGVARLVRV